MTCVPCSLRGRDQSGSGYLLALLVMVILTLAGISLVAITSTELQLGASERLDQKALYAADAGVASATARAVVGADYRGHTFILTDVDTQAGLELGHRVEVSPFVPVLKTICNLCEISNAAQYGDEQYYSIHFAVGSVATRRAGNSPVVLAERRVTSMIELQPQQLRVDALEPLLHPEELSKIDP